jgi:hypothetical protein
VNKEMPRMYRLRIVGLKYNKMKKRYDDKTFQFHNNQEAVSALISLINGGGKGALLQTISQIMMPGTSWGSKDERKFQHFFYNEKGLFKPYIFYVVIEWLLDTPNREFLLTGIALTAEKIISKNGEEIDAKIKAKYRLFTKNYNDDMGDATLSTLLLPTDEKGTTFEKAIEHLDENKMDLHHRSKDFHKHVESFGLSKEEWEIMKRINKEEGGVKDYFKNAEDNHSLFHQKIIPTISQQLGRQGSNGSSTDLTEIFRSQASIAKDLPVLIKRESSLKELISWIEPLRQSVEKGIELRQLEKKNEQKGHKFVLAFDQLIGVQKSDYQEYENDLKAIKNKINILNWEKANLKYARLYRQLEVLEHEIKEQQLLLTDIKNNFTSQQNLLKSTKVELLLVQWNELNSKIRFIDNEMNSIKNSFENQEIDLKMEEIKLEIMSQWEDFYPKLVEIIQIFNTFQLQNNNKKNRLYKELKALIQKNAEKNSKINSLIEMINSFNVYSKQMKNEYSEKIIYHPDSLIQQFQKEFQSSHKLKEEAVKKLSESIEGQKQTSGNIGKINAELEEKTKLYNEAKENLAIQLEKEWSVGKEISNLLQEEITDLVPIWLNSARYKLETKLKDLENDLLKARETQWKTQLDISISKQPYWIANHDLKMLKELLENEVDLFYGTEFLKELPLDKRILEMERNPLIVHGLVLARKDWEKLNKSTFDKILLHSPVPFFIREEMDSYNQTSFVLLKEQSRNMSLDEEYFNNWKQGIENQLISAKETVNQYESYKKNISDKLKEINLLLNQPSSIDIEKRKQNLKTTINDLNQKDLLEKAKLKNFEDDEKAAKIAVDSHIEKIKHFEQCLEKVREFKIRKSSYEKNKEDKDLLEDSLKIDEESRKNLEIAHEAAGKEIEKWNEIFYKWSEKRKNDIDRIKLVIPSATFPIINDCIDVNGAPILSDTFFELIFVKITEYESLNQSQHEKDSRLQVLAIDKKHYTNNKNGHESNLNKLTNNWRNLSIPNEHQSILESKIDLLEEEEEQIRKDLETQQGNVNKLEGSINTQKDLLQETEKEIIENNNRSVDTWDDLDLDEKDYMIKENYKVVLSDEEEVNGLLELTKNKMNEYIKFKQVLQSTLPSQTDIALEPSIVQLIQNETEKTINDWTNQRKSIKDNKEKHHLKIDLDYTKFKQDVSNASWDLDLKSKILKTLETLPLGEYNFVLQTVDGMKTFALSSISQLSKDKEKAEEAENYWTTRASMKIISIIDHLKLMIKKMVIENENGHKFPLVKLKQDDLPEKPEDIEYVLKEHFRKSIEKITKMFDKIESGNPELDEEIYRIMSDEQIVFEALRHRYPTLMVYNLQTNNAFRYERPKDEYYSTWETINKGSETETSGSGGQTLSARMVIMMMLLSLKNHSHKWTTLICDNPFGQAASEHVLDPIFAASELLRFQLIVVTPPELVKTGISQRFPVYYALDLKEEKGVEKIQETVQYSFRTYHESRPVMKR